MPRTNEDLVDGKKEHNLYAVKTFFSSGLSPFQASATVLISLFILFIILLPLDEFIDLDNIDLVCRSPRFLI